MSDFMTDLNAYLRVNQNNSAKSATNSTNKKAGTELDMMDFLTLMVAQFQNQTMDDTASTSEMMNQMVQMSVIQAVTNLSTLITQSNSMSYAASLVGKEVSIAEKLGNKITGEIRGVVTGTGVFNGEQVIFIGDKQYALGDVMAVGTLPGNDPLQKTESSGNDDKKSEGSGGSNSDSNPGSTGGINGQINSNPYTETNPYGANPPTGTEGISGGTETNPFSGTDAIEDSQLGEELNDIWGDEKQAENAEAAQEQQEPNLPAKEEIPREVQEEAIQEMS